MVHNSMNNMPRGDSSLVVGGGSSSKKLDSNRTMSAAVNDYQTAAPQGGRFRSEKAYSSIDNARNSTKCNFLPPSLINPSIFL